MKYSIRQNWLSSLELIVKKPILLLPFIIFAFIEGLILEIVYFSIRRPISFVAGPIIKKFFGESFLHYPGNLLLLPRLFYYLEVTAYIIIGVFLMGAAITIFKNIKGKLPLKTDAIIKSALKMYPAFLAYGILVVVLVFLLKNLDIFLVAKVSKSLLVYYPNVIPKLAPSVTAIFLFLTHIIMQVFLVSTLPLIVMQNKSFLKALIGSIYLGIRNFFGLFGLIFIPLLLYFPITLVKSLSLRLAHLAIPEITLYITVAGIVIGMFIDCFVIVCASHFVAEKVGTRR